MCFLSTQFSMLKPLRKANWEVRFPVKAIGNQVMAVFVDIYGNEAREVIPASGFGVSKAKVAAKHAKSIEEDEEVSR